jgi:hypothetical protein
MGRGEVNMRKKEKVQMGESTVRREKEGKDRKEESDKNLRLSAEINCLKLDSLVNIPNKTTNTNNQRSKNHSKIS